MPVSFSRAEPGSFWGSVFWNLSSAGAIGLSYFIIGATNTRDTTYWDHFYDVSLIWLSTGLVGLIVAVSVFASIGHVAVAGRALDVQFPPSRLDQTNPYRPVEVAPLESVSNRGEEATTLTTRRGNDEIRHSSSSASGTTTAGYLPASLKLDGYGHLSGAPLGQGINDLVFDRLDCDLCSTKDQDRTTPGMGGGEQIIQRVDQDINAGEMGWCGGRMCLGTSSLRKWSTVGLIALGGVLMSLSQAFLKIAFGVDRVDWGPITSVTCGDVIFVTLFFFVFMGLKVTKTDAVSMLLVGLGILMMLFVDVNEALTVRAIAYALAASFCLGSSVIFIRLGVLVGISPLTGFVIRMVTQGLMGLILLGYVLLFHWASYVKTYQGHQGRFLLPILAGVAQSVAVLAVNKAMVGMPSKSSPPAILSLSPVVVLFLGFVVFGDVPRPTLAVGMVVTLAGCLTPVAVRLFTWCCLYNNNVDLETDAEGVVIVAESPSTPFLHHAREASKMPHPIMPPPPAQLTARPIAPQSDNGLGAAGCDNACPECSSPTTFASLAEPETGDVNEGISDQGDSEGQSMGEDGRLVLSSQVSGLDVFKLI
eukprot:GHVN01014780.1.p1 GENE.GHVN01014780.1~~GHVN01014780.1.p1  ORF type:complete len:591 (+),score=57.74 GHVN01014780.1:90-1862(+)